MKPFESPDPLGKKEQYLENAVATEESARRIGMSRTKEPEKALAYYNKRIAALTEKLEKVDEITQEQLGL